jgi:DNA-binding MarR family transcriptional regulator
MDDATNVNELGPQQQRAFACLAAHLLFDDPPRGLTGRALAERIGVSVRRAHQLIDDLDARELIRRNGPKAGAVELTVSGRIAAAAAMANGGMGEFLAGLQSPPTKLEIPRRRA